MNGLRLLAAALIVLFHAASAGSGTGFDADPGLGSLFQLFDLGVPVFFVLSGFLLYRPMVASRLTGTPHKSVGRYLWHRFRRIYPAYWVVLFLAAWAGYAELGSGIQTIQIAALFQIYDPVIYFGGLVVAWSLCTEVSFYAYLPIHNLVMKFTSKGAPGKRVVDEWIACVVLIGISLGFKVWFFATLPHQLGFAYLPRFIDTFAVGMALAVFSVAETRRQQHGTLYLTIQKLGAVPWALAAALVLITSWYQFPAAFSGEEVSMLEGTGRDLVKLLVAALLVAPLVVDRDGTSPLGRFLSTPVMRWWGEFSYGIFLIHLPLLTWIQREHLRQPPELLATLWLAAVALMASTALAAVLYWTVEWPLQRLDPFRGRRTDPAPTDTDTIGVGAPG